jgi:hypothetical protein
MEPDARPEVGIGCEAGKVEPTMPNGRKRKRKKIATHKRKKRLRKNRHKKK